MNEKKFLDRITMNIKTKKFSDEFFLDRILKKDIGSPPMISNGKDRSI
jgi:hypothetical protein